MNSKKYAKAIDLIVDTMFEIDKIEHNQKWLESVRNTRAAKECEKEACSLISQTTGMKEMLALLSGKDYDTVCSDVYEAKYPEGIPTQE